MITQGDPTEEDGVLSFPLYFLGFTHKVKSSLVGEKRKTRGALILETKEEEEQRQGRKRPQGCLDRGTTKMRKNISCHEVILRSFKKKSRQNTCRLM